MSGGTIQQAMARKKKGNLPLMLSSVILVVFLASAALLYRETQRTEVVQILARDVPYGQQIVADDLRSIDAPYYRAAELAGMANPAAVIGQYAARNLGANDLLQPSMLMASPPDQPVYPNGEVLSANMVPVPFSTLSIGPLNFRDRVNIGFSDPSGDPKVCDAAQAAAQGEPSPLPTGEQPLRPYACRLLSDVRVLFVDEAQQLAYLELTPYQAHTIWAAQAAGMQLWGERYGASSEPIDPMQRLDVGQVAREPLTEAVPTPVPATDTSAPSSIPGSGTTLPGQP